MTLMALMRKPLMGKVARWNRVSGTYSEIFHSKALFLCPPKVTDCLQTYFMGDVHFPYSSVTQPHPGLHFFRRKVG
jgi:hypothetical protein